MSPGLKTGLLKNAFLSFFSFLYRRIVNDSKILTALDDCIVFRDEMWSTDVSSGQWPSDATMVTSRSCFEQSSLGYNLYKKTVT
jgi:hypothetical protein